MRVAEVDRLLEGKVFYPNNVFFTRERHSYIRLETDNRLPGVTIELSIANAEGATMLALRRVLDKTGNTVFPLGDIFEGIIAEIGVSYVKDFQFSLTLKSMQSNGDVAICKGAFAIIMSGYSDREIEDVTDADPAPTNPYPYPPRIVIYPNLNRDISLFIPSTRSNAEINVSIHRGEEIIASVNNSDESQAPPFYVFNPCTVAEWDEGIWSAHDKTLVVREKVPRPSIPGRPTYMYLTLFYVAFEVDECMNGVFLEWKDKHGLTHIYRWTLESTTEEIVDSESYTQLDETLQPVEQEIKTIAKKYKLHSRRVDKGLFDLCKSIIGNKELRMLNADTGEWEGCKIEDTKAEDKGEVLNDLVINVVKNEYL